MNSEPNQEPTPPSCEDSTTEESQETGSVGARRKALVILEVLGGVRSPTAAAEELGIPTPRYYQWEERAVAGMVASLEPKKRGPQRNLERELESVRQELKESRSECARYEALLRSAQRTIGLQPATGGEAAAGATDSGGKRRRSRRPSVRAMTAIRKIERQAGSSGPPDRSSGSAEPPAPE